MIEFAIHLITQYWQIFAGLCVLGLAVLIIFWKTWVSLFIKHKEVCMYILFGGLTTLINLIVYDLLTEKAGVSILLATLVSWIISVLFAFVTNKLFVFESKNYSSSAWIKEGIKFFSARLFSLGIEEVFMLVCCNLLHFNDKICKILAQALIAILNYFLGKLVVFEKE